MDGAAGVSCDFESDEHAPAKSDETTSRDTPSLAVSGAGLELSRGISEKPMVPDRSPDGITASRIDVGASRADVGHVGRILSAEDSHLGLVYRLSRYVRRMACRPVTLRARLASLGAAR